MIAMLLLAAQTAAPAPLRLQDLLREARERNPDLLAVRAQARAAAAAVSPAGALEDPMLMVQLWNAPANFSSQPVMLQIQQNLPLGGKRSARRDAASADARAAEASTLARARDVEAEVAKAYFDLFLAGRTIEIDDGLVDTLRALAEAAGARVGSGKGELVDQLKAQAELLKVRSGRETAIAQGIAARAQLAALLDREPAELSGPTATPSLLPALPAEAELRARALRERPELVAAEASIASADAQRRLSEAARVPDIGLFAAGMHTFGNVEGERNFVFAGVQGNLPVFGGSKTTPRIVQAQAQREAVAAQARSLRNKVIAEVAQAYAQVVAETHQVALHHQLIPVARQTLSSALTSYAAGRSAFLTALDSERELQMHELDLASHLVAYEQRLAELTRAVGTDLGLAAAAEAGSEEVH